MDEQEQRMLQAQFLEAKLKELEEQLMMIERQINELQVCSIAIDDLKNVKIDSEMLVPINPGVFIRARLSNNEDIIINTGAKVFAKKNSKEAKDFIQEKLDKAIEIHNNIMEQINAIVESVNNS